MLITRWGRTVRFQSKSVWSVCRGAFACDTPGVGTDKNIREIRGQESLRWCHANVRAPPEGRNERDWPQEAKEDEKDGGSCRDFFRSLSFFSASPELPLTIVIRTHAEPTVLMRTSLARASSSFGGECLSG
jgi:hypothetical protein